MASMISFAEQQAEAASRRAKFAINISELRSAVSDILSQFGRFGFFDSYTKHDISHIDEMLASLDWIIPESSRHVVSPADWFLIVSSIFLHDIGLLVTKEEFERRGESEFSRFVANRLFSGTGGQDYKERLNNLTVGDRDRFLYEEFVRENHGKRARAWIEGREAPELGVTGPALALVQKVLSSLDEAVRADLGVIVESHNLDDLKDIAKYPVEKPYASKTDDIANIQYCAVILRTADLLQITQNRAPTTLLKIINPVDPVSQVEWIKQNAVRMVRGKVGRTAEGNADPSLPQDTIEIFANFKEQNGYFGLDAFLEYAEKQIRASNAIIEASRMRDGVRHEFRWRNIDTENIKTDGFLKRPFRFEIDKAKILDLLTGHTLYNDSLIVLRELVQNALDAVRLFALARREGAAQEPWSGYIKVIWDPSRRILDVIDNGTGMSQETIENHLLRVGASKYQEPQFKKEYPDFFPISRFGIGVLSTFMVADAVEILTTERGEEFAREISLRSVHGRYLIKTLNKRTDTGAQPIGCHGTRFRLTVRPSAKTENLLTALKAWIIVPKCNVTFQEIGCPELQIGFHTAGGAVEGILAEAGMVDGDNATKYKVIEKQIDGITIAYALQWADAYREWSLVPTSSRVARRDTIFRLPTTCVCVHGIAVEFVTPGFKVPSILLVADASGRRAPKTNVARTALEENEDSELFGEAIYRTLISAVQDEIARLQAEELFTVTKATNEVVYLAALLSQDEGSAARYPERLKAAVASLPVFLIEGGEALVRKAYSVAEIASVSEFWTLEGEVVRSAESLLAQFESDKTIHSAIDFLSGGRVALPSPLLSNFSSLGRFQSSLFERFEIVEIAAQPGLRQIKFHWCHLKDPRSWVDLSSKLDGAPDKDIRLNIAIRDSFQQQVFNRFGLQSVQIPRLLAATDTLTTEGLEGFGFVRSYRTMFLLPAEPITKFLREFVKKTETCGVGLAIFLPIVAAAIRIRKVRPGDTNVERIVGDCLQIVESQFTNMGDVPTTDFSDAILASSISVYDPFIWSSRTTALYES